MPALARYRITGQPKFSEKIKVFRVTKPMTFRGVKYAVDSEFDIVKAKCHPRNARILFERRTIGYFTQLFPKPDETKLAQFIQKFPRLITFEKPKHLKKK